MKQKPSTAHTRRKQLDRILSKMAALRETNTPARGWIHQIRTALGMSADALARRMRVKRATVMQFEQSEVAETIALKTLRRAADTLGCRLVYAFIPRDSLDVTLREQARKAAEKIVARVQHTMRLEAQGGSSVERAEQIEDIANELVRTLSPDLWKGV